MGKGDIKTRRGKIFRGTHGKLRPRKTNKPVQVAAKAEKPKKK
jgi:ribosomal small subunit protein bTHX